VLCEVARTVAPEITDPVLSVIVPEKLPFYCACRSGQMASTNKEKTTTRSERLVGITTLPEVIELPNAEPGVSFAKSL
jgi:hypothetical protein